MNLISLNKMKNKIILLISTIISSFIFTRIDCKGGIIEYLNLKKQHNSICYFISHNLCECKIKKIAFFFDYENLLTLNNIFLKRGDKHAFYTKRKVICEIDINYLTPPLKDNTRIENIEVYYINGKEIHSQETFILPHFKLQNDYKKWDSVLICIRFRHNGSCNPEIFYRYNVSERSNFVQFNRTI